MGEVIAVASGKGGTGKTSFVAGVGMALAQLGYPTLCLDCDVGLRNLDIALAMTDLALMDFTDVMDGRCSLEQAAVRHPGERNLYLLTAPGDARSGDISAGSFCRLLSAVRERFAWCLVDAPAGLGSGFRLATAGADRAVVVTTAESSSLRDAQHTAMELASFPPGRLHLVVNRCQKKMLRRLHQTIDDAMDAAGLPLLGVVPEDPRVALSAGRGEALLLSEKDGAAQAYRNIARRLVGRRVRLMKLR